MKNIKKKRLLILVPLISTIVPFAIAPQAEAKGCIKGAAVGAAAGHVAKHHGVLGALAGCVVGHHMATKAARAKASAPAPTVAK